MQKTIKKTKGKDGLVALCILGPMLLWWVVANGFPVLFGLSLGFMDWRGFIDAPKFNGFANFIYFFQDPIYYMSLWNALWMGTVCMVLTMIVSFVGAVIIESLPKGKGIFRTLWYIPAVTAVAAISQIFLILFDPTFGVINRILATIHLPAINVNDSFPSAIFMIIFYSVWKGVGGSMLLWIAGLQSVDKALYEAAGLDGAGRLKKMWHITLPSLKPFVTYSVITGAIAAIQIYEQVAFISGGNPLGQTQTTVFLIMKDAFYDFNFGMAGASSIIMTLVVLVFAILYLMGQRESVNKAVKKR